MVIGCPVKTYIGNIAVSDKGEFYAIYRLKGHIYNFIGVEQKESRFFSSNNMLQTLATLTPHIKLSGKPYFSSLRELNERNKKTFKGELAEFAEAFVDGVTEQLIAERGDDSSEMETFLTVKLPQPPMRRMSIRERWISGTYHVWSWLGLDNNDIPAVVFESYLEVEKKIFDKLSHRLIRASRPDMEWMFRQPSFRGIGDPKLFSLADEEWTPGYDLIMKKGDAIIVPDQRDVITMAKGVTEFEAIDSVYKIKHPDGKISYQTNFAVSKIPGMYFTESEWIYHLKMLGFPVEWSADVQFVQNSNFKRDVDLQKNLVDDQYRHTVKTNDIPVHLQDSYEGGVEQEAEAQRGKEAYTLTNFNLNISSSSESELRERMIELCHYFERFDIEIENPVSDQKKMHNEYYPCTDKQSTSYTKRLSTRCLAGYMFDATTKVGDQTGLLLGEAGHNRKPFFIDLRNASLTDRSPSVVSTGTLGGGKTILGYLLSFFNAIIGGKSLIINPKGDTRDWTAFIPALKGFFERLEITGDDKYVGMLDPIMMQDIASKVGADKEMAKREAMEQGVSLLGFLMDAGSSDDIMIAINESVKYAKDHEIPCMERVIDFAGGGYQNNPRMLRFEHEFEKLYSHLEAQKASKIMSLVFGNGQNKVIRTSKRITVLNIHGLNIPGKAAERRQYTPEQVASVAVINSLAGFVKKFAFEDKTIFYFIHLDEQWFWTKAPIGQAVLDEIMKQGRSLNTGMYVVDQNSSAMPDEVRNLIGVRCVFRCTSQGEAESSCKLLGLEPTKENIDLILNMPKHHVLIQDLDGRVDLIHIRIIFKELLEAFDTNPLADILRKESESVERDNQ